jgi:cytochrome c biogenesis protein CcdA
MGPVPAFKGTYLLLIYSLGLGLSFFIIGIAFDALRKQLSQLQRYSAVII